MPKLLTMLCCIATITAGCSTRPSVRIFEPQSETLSANTTTSAPRVAFATRNDSTQIVIDCPLPGSQHGKPYSSIYMVLPTLDGRFDFANRTIRGLYVQHSGPRAGWTRIASGFVEWSPPTLGLGSHTAAFNIRTADTTHVTGTFKALRDERRVRQFERRHADYITALTAAP